MSGVHGKTNSICFRRRVAQVLLHRSDDAAKAWKAKHARHVQAHFAQLQ